MDADSHRPRWQRARVIRAGETFRIGALLWVRVERPQVFDCPLRRLSDGATYYSADPRYRINVLPIRGGLGVCIRTDSLELLTEFADDVPMVTIEELQGESLG